MLGSYFSYLFLVALRLSPALVRAGQVYLVSHKFQSKLILSLSLFCWVWDLSLGPHVCQSITPLLGCILWPNTLIKRHLLTYFSVTCLYVSVFFVWRCLKKTEDNWIPPELWFQEVTSFWHQYGGPTSAPLQEQQAHFTTEPSLQPSDSTFNMKVTIRF